MKIGFIKKIIYITPLLIIYTCIRFIETCNSNISGIHWQNKIMQGYTTYIKDSMVYTY